MGDPALSHCGEVMAKNTKKTVEELAQPLIEQLGYIYVDTEYEKQGQNRVLTLFIDKEDGGVLLDDCETVSRAVEIVLDERDVVAEQYMLCVSSPGLDRPLKNVRDFKRALGRIVDVRLYKPFQEKKEFTGVLTKYTENSITIETEEEEIVFELKEAAKISLHLEI